METLEIGIREFGDRLAYMESDAPVAITRDGDLVGYYMPARRKRSETERYATTKVAAVRWPEVLAVEGIPEEEALNAFRQWRMDRRK
jgi:hypothetical protein